MSDESRHIEILFSRLMWPSGMVRERTCRAIAGLLKEPLYRNKTQEALLKWLQEQKLESVVCLGLLCFVRARLDGNEALVPERNTLEKAIERPSIISHMLLREIYSGNPSWPVARELHSETAPKGFNASSFFQDRMRLGLPPIYQIYADKIPDCDGASFSSQWSYEWDVVKQRIGELTVPDPWVFPGRPDRHHYGAVDSLLTETYRSSFLRALTWAFDHRAINHSELRHLCAKTLPVDLGLWSVKSVQLPKWWPKSSEPQGEIDTVPAQIWEALPKLYDQNIKGKEDWAIAYASGRVHEGKNIYDLTIRGCFQKCTGPEVPDSSLICDWYDANIQEWEAPDELWLRGKLNNSFSSNIGMTLDDWDLFPSAVAVLPRTACTWLHWRVRRGIFLPSAFLGGEESAFSPEGQELLIKDEKGVWAKWSDWPYKLREMTDANLSQSRGQHLLVDRERMAAFSEANQLTFCWICELVGYSRKHGYGEFDIQRLHQVLGASAVCLP